MFRKYWLILAGLAQLNNEEELYILFSYFLNIVILTQFSYQRNIT